MVSAKRCTMAKPRPRPLRRSRRVRQLVKFVKNRLQMFGSNAAAGIPHTQCQAVTALAAGNEHAAAVGVAQGVGNQVAHHQACEGFVGISGGAGLTRAVHQVAGIGLGAKFLFQHTEQRLHTKAGAARA